jgi:hypothetical protein
MWTVLRAGALEAFAGLAIVVIGMPVYLWFRRSSSMARC